MKLVPAPLIIVYKFLRENFNILKTMKRFPGSDTIKDRNPLLIPSGRADNTHKDMDQFPIPQVKWSLVDRTKLTYKRSNPYIR